MKMYVAILATAYAISMPSVARAQDRAQGLAQALVDATQLAEQFMQAKKACEQTERAIDVESIAQAYPDMFLKIGPDDPRWAKARAAYVRYGVSTCVPQNIDSYVTAARTMYEGALSEKELAEANSFYASPAGKKFAAISSSVSAELNKKMHQESEELRESEARRLEADMLSIGSNNDGG